MKTLHGGMLWKTFQELSAAAKCRVWVASPYIGDWGTVRTLLGSTWWKDIGVDFRTLTDFEEVGNYATLRNLMKRGPVRHLRGLHAKLYVFDDNVILTSANLTRAGFNKRFEVGVRLEGQEAFDSIAYFKQCWDARSKELTPEQNLRFDTAAPGLVFSDEPDGEGLQDQWGMPPSAPESNFAAPEKKATSSYQRFVMNHRDLQEVYSENGRVWNDIPLSLEVDAFLNFLYHDHPLRPSYSLAQKTSGKREMSKEDRAIEVASYFKQFATHEQNDDRNHQDRVACFKCFQSLLEKSVIMELEWPDVKLLCESLHSLGTYVWNLTSFLDPQMNSLATIRGAWRELLYGSDGVESRIAKCDRSLKNIGQSSIQELLGWHNPTKYPIRNNNTDTGMSFFGYSA